MSHFSNFKAPQQASFASYNQIYIYGKINLLGRNPRN